MYFHLHFASTPSRLTGSLAQNFKPGEGTGWKNEIRLPVIRTPMDK